MKTLHTQPEVFLDELISLERCGKYDEALAELKDIWEDKTALPDIEDFEPRIAAEILLRCGSLFGFLGHIKQIPNSQEKSKNLLTDARQRFFDIYDLEKIAECENHLALTYWRRGELDEAEVWIEESASHNLPANCYPKLHSFIIRCLIWFQQRKIKDSLGYFLPIEKDFLECEFSNLKGDFYNHFGLVLRNLQNPLEAVEKYELAKFYYQEADHQSYLAAVENNLAYLYKSEKDFVKAHRSIDNATEIFSQIKDRTREGFSLDTKAQIYFDEEKFTDALETIEESVKVLQRGENFGYLVETYQTKMKILLALGEFSSATFCLFDAVQLAKTYIGEETAKNLVKEFETEVTKKNSQNIVQLFDEKELINGDLELILPPSISHYSQYQAVRIKNTHLERIGLKQNSLAIVADENVDRGDLAAILQVDDGSVFCGFYDSDFGIVCLAGIDSEPQLLDEKDIKILGKIVGVCDPEKNSDGKLVVRSLQK